MFGMADLGFIPDAAARHVGQTARPTDPCSQKIRTIQFFSEKTTMCWVSCLEGSLGLERLLGLEIDYVLTQPPAKK